MFEGIDPKVLGAVRGLARELRYRHLPSIVGRRVRINAVDGIDTALRAALPEVPNGAKLGNDVEYVHRALAKYGFLDLHYEVAAIDAPPIGYRALRELGLLARDEAESAADPVLSNQEVVAWLDECRTGPPLLKLFLEGPAPRDILPGYLARRGFDGGLLGEYLPQEFTVIDACETTGSFIWLAKHFYL